jgi:DNA mismatch repair protein MutS
MSGNPSLDTPMMRQYLAIKAEYQDAILFFRLGDFYEMFLDDAQIASKELGLTLTGRGKDENRVPMCGLPYHASASYISRLIQAGYKVAICEQVEEASEGKGITKREVVQVITPGTIINHDLIEASTNNYLAGIMPLAKQGGYGFSFVDITTGEFKLSYCQTDMELYSQLDRLGCKEIIIAEHMTLTLDDTLLINELPMLDALRAKEELCRHFKIQSLSAFGLESMTDALPIAWALLDYLKKTQKNSVPQITRCLAHATDKTMSIDKVSIRNLELTQGLHSKDKAGTLFWVIDYTKTAMGARMLKQLIHNPSTDIGQITLRLDAVEILVEDLLSREEIRDVLQQVYDLERLLSRIVSEHHNPRDCMALMHSLMALKDLSGILGHLDKSVRLKEYHTFFKHFDSDDSPFKQLITLIQEGLIDTPPAVIRDGGFIRDGFNLELDELMRSFEDIRHWINGLEERERAASGIKTLKVGFNKVFGYYFQVSNGMKDNVPEHYIRKQTLTQGERFITPELKEKETILLTGKEKQTKLEIELFHEIVQTIKHFIPDLQKLASIVAQLDCLQSFATVSQKHRYTRPQFVESGELKLDIVNGRHPVLEKSTGVQVIPNSMSMRKESNRFMLITGPNMAGKSTLMRQVALTVVMAQIGCFVPAESLSMSIVDKLFTRIGALDNLYSGQSTFMVEMLESASILHNATEQSLIILDELGRGTSTYDGMSIAGAITEYIHNEIGARTFFATHYHELSLLSDTLSGLSNYSMAISESDGKIAFTYVLKAGQADKSYGIHVAEMAGLPESVIQRATLLLNEYETKEGCLQ